MNNNGSAMPPAAAAEAAGGRHAAAVGRHATATSTIIFADAEYYSMIHGDTDMQISHTTTAAPSPGIRHAASRRRLSRR